MSSINSNLTNEELQLIVQQTKSEKINRVLNIVKAIALGVASIFAFAYVTKPQSEHTINKERTKLILEIIKEKDPKIRAQGIALIRETYPTLNQVLDQIVNSIKEDAYNDVINKYSEEYQILVKKKQQLQSTLSSTNNSIERQIILNNLKMIELQLEEVNKLIERYK